LKEQHLQYVEKLKIEYEKRITLSEQQRLNIIEYGEKVQNVEAKLRERIKTAITLDTMKEQALTTNDDLREAQRCFFTELKEIQ
jgi:hypothetical protein